MRIRINFLAAIGIIHTATYVHYCSITLKGSPSQFLISEGTKSRVH